MVTFTFSEVISPTKRLVRCDACRAVTDDPYGHAEWHATTKLDKVPSKPGKKPKVDGEKRRKDDGRDEVEVTVDRDGADA